MAFQVLQKAIYDFLSFFPFWYLFNSYFVIHHKHQNRFKMSFFSYSTSVLSPIVTSINDKVPMSQAVGRLTSPYVRTYMALHPTTTFNDGAHKLNTVSNVVMCN